MISALAAAAPARASIGRLAELLRAPRVAYEGEASVLLVRDGKEVRRELLVAFSPPGRYRRDLLDRYGFTVFTIVSDGETEWVYDRRRATAYRGEPADADYKLLDPDEELDLLSENYELRRMGRSRAAGKSCELYELASRRNGGRVRSFCRDPRSGVVLRRRVYGPDGALVSEFRFLRLSAPAGLADSRFRFTPPAGTKVVANRLKPDYMELEDAARATAMKPRPPAWLPPGYIFESMNILPYQGSTLLHYRYSDGVDVLSLFQAPDRLRLDFGAGTDGRPRDLDIPGATGRVALWRGGKILEWMSGDRFILIGRVPLDELVRMAAAVPPREER